MPGKFIFYKQPDAMDCGPTCLKMIARYYHRHFSLQYLREKCQIGKEGVNLLGISEAAESIGFRCRPVQLSFKLLKESALLPAILHWQQNHFVVLYEINGKRASKQRFKIADPSRGLISLSYKEFEDRWMHIDQNGQRHGIALLMETTPFFYSIEEDKGNEENKKRKQILHYILPYKKYFFQLAIGIGIATIIQLVLPFMTQSIVDTGIHNSNLQFIYLILFGQLALAAGRLTIEFVRSRILFHIGTRISLTILTDFIIKLMKLPVSFFDSKRTGDILQRMNDHTRIQNFLTSNSLNTLFAVLNLLIFSIVLLCFNTSIFLVFSIFTFIYAAWILIFLKKRRTLDYQRFEADARLQSASIQMTQAMQDIKLNGIEQPIRWNWERLQVKLFKLSIRSLSLEQWQQAGGFFMNEGKNIFITFLSAKAVIEGQLTLGTMLAIQYIIGQLNSPVEQLISFIQGWQNAKISIDRLNEIHLLEEEEPYRKSLQATLPTSFALAIKGGRNPFFRDPVLETTEQLNYFEKPASSTGSVIQFRNVSFAYAGMGDAPILKDIDLILPQGKTTAIVGVSGSGKTTLLKLLLKFYDPQKGTILLENTPLSNISHKVWRKQCGVVMQESYIFSDTIEKNITLAEDKGDPYQLEQALEIANLQDFIAQLPLGLKTRIGMEGTGISMGQKQRILIARAVYRNPQFIIFDEATNSLDANNESIIINNLRNFFKRRTVVIVAHRLSTVKDAHQIVVLNAGRITERGSHQQLVNLRGEYFTLIQNQLELGI